MISSSGSQGANSRPTLTQAQARTTWRLPSRISVAMTRMGLARRGRVLMKQPPGRSQAAARDRHPAGS